MCMIVYDKLWETMKKKGITQYKLIHEYHGDIATYRSGKS